MVEFALVLPILLLLLCGILDFGWYFYNQLSLDNACRDGARFAIVQQCQTTEQLEALKGEIEQRAVTTNVRKTLTDFQVEIVTGSDEDIKDYLTVNMTASMRVLTPVMSAIVQGTQHTLSSSVTMRIETINIIDP